MKNRKSKPESPVNINHTAYGSVTGKINKVQTNGEVWVTTSGNGNNPVLARFSQRITIGELTRALQYDQDVLLIFENNDPQKPVIVEILFSLLSEITKTPKISSEDCEEKVPVEEVIIDGKKKVIKAQEEISFQCGKASISLKSDGKIVLKGTHLISYSSGVNKIKGGKVKIN